MTDVLIYADTVRSPELRHEVPIGIPDPSSTSSGTAVGTSSISSMEIPRLAELGRFELHPLEEFGLDELSARRASLRRVRDEVAMRAVAGSGRAAPLVPEAFPLWLADRLRAEGVELTVDRDALRRSPAREDRRRARGHPPRPARRRGRDGRGARPAPRATGNGDGLQVDGEPLTVERVKAAISQAFAAHGTTADDFIVSPGPQAASATTWARARSPPASRS